MNDDAKLVDEQDPWETSWGASRPQAPLELINIKRKEMSALIALQGHYKELIVYVGYSLWRKTITLIRCPDFENAVSEFLRTVGGDANWPLAPGKMLGMCGNLSSLSSILPSVYLQERRPVLYNDLDRKPAYGFGVFLCGLTSNCQIDALSWMLDSLQLDLSTQWSGPVPTMNHPTGTLLHLAAESGCPALVQLLLDRGADPVGENYGDLALHCVSSVSVAKVLLQTNKYPDLDVLARGFWAMTGNTPLLSAASRSSKEVVEYFISLGADTSKKKVGGANLIHLAAATNRASVLELLLAATKQTHDVNAVDNAQCSPLHLLGADFRASSGDAQAHRRKVELLINAGADVELGNGIGQTPLVMAAAHRGSEPVVRALVELGSANINARDADGRTPLTWAILAKNIGVVRYLLEILATGEHGTLCNEFRKSMLHLVVDHGRQQPAPENLFDEIVALLVDHGAQVETHYKDPRGLKYKNRTPIYRAVQVNNFFAVRALHRVAKAQLSSHGLKDGQTLLHVAAQGGFVEIVQYLADQDGCDLNAMDDCGRTPLYYAARGPRPGRDQIGCSSLEVVRILIDKGSKLDGIVEEYQ